MDSIQTIQNIVFDVKENISNAEYITVQTELKKLYNIIQRENTENDEENNAVIERLLQILQHARHEHRIEMENHNRLKINHNLLVNRLNEWIKIVIYQNLFVLLVCFFIFYLINQHK
jgi:hypothetical protein